MSTSKEGRVLYKKGNKDTDVRKGRRGVKGHDGRIIGDDLRRDEQETQLNGVPGKDGCQCENTYIISRSTTTYQHGT